LRQESGPGGVRLSSGAIAHLADCPVPPPVDAETAAAGLFLSGCRQRPPGAGRGR